MPDKAAPTDPAVKRRLWAEYRVAQAGIRPDDLAYARAITMALDGFSWQYIAGHFGVAEKGGRGSKR
jgi:hypothetical protein